MIIETVGVGQAETEIADVADTVAVVVQPGSGDALQFLKAGIMEVPDVLVVTKADLGQVAMKARRDLSAALRSLGATRRPRSSRSLAAAASGRRRALAALERHRARIDVAARAARAGAAPRRCARSRSSTARRRCDRSVGGARPSALLDAADPDLDERQLVATARGAAGERVAEARLGVGELSMIVGAFVVATLLAELLGAINLGTALAFGQMALAATVVYIMLRAERLNAPGRRRDLRVPVARPFAGAPEPVDRCSS